MRRARVMIAAVALMAPAVLAADPAGAASPSNDVKAGAQVIDLGATVSQDTTEATTDADDVAANANCGAPATDASVWFTYTPATDATFVVDVSSSDYTAGVIVLADNSLVTCGPGAVAVAGTAGTSYSILAFDDQFDGGGNGGTLVISVVEAPPTPTLDVTVNPTGTVNARTGTATLTGTVTCTDADFLFAFGQLTQRVGRGTVNGEFFIFSEGQCDGAAYPWSAEVTPLNGKFAGGKSAAVTFSFACGPFECADGYDEQVVQLRGGRSR